MKIYNLHVDVFITKSAAHNSSTNLLKTVYFTLLDSCRQDMKSKLAVSNFVLSQFHHDNPTVVALACRSDNARCYAGASCFEAEYQVCKEMG